jgi:hypothetical protein
MRMRTLLLSAMIVAGLFWTIPAWANIPTMTVSEIEPGMKGIGKTVIRGTDIQEFDCQVIDVFKTMGYNHGPLILVRITGPVVDESGGIAGGYSGSPVFIDGRLIGAISWGPYYTHGDVAGITPINEMLKAFTYPSEKTEQVAEAPVCLREPVKIADATYNSISLAENAGIASDIRNTWGSDTLVLTPCKTPLIVNGLSEQGMERLKEFAADKLPYLDIVQGPGGGSSQGVPVLLGPTVLEPGASIGAQLASGDLDMTAIGTLTWVDDDGRFVAFGHPFLSDGDTSLPFLTTKVVFTMPALDRSYKLGEPIEVVGTVTQDRLTAIAGHLRQIPDMVKFNLEVVDDDLQKTTRYNYSVVNKEQFLPFLGMMIPMEGLGYATDRTGPGTCKVSFTFRGEGLAEPITRENMMYSAFSASSESLNEFSECLNMLTSMNAYREVKLTNVDIRVEISQKRESTDIQRARFQNAPNIGPGAIGYKGPDKQDGANNTPSSDISADETGEAGEASEIEAGNIAANDIPKDVPPDEAAILEGEQLDMLNMDSMGIAPTKLVGYKPGDTVEVLVTLRPYRGDPVEQVITLQIPADFKAGQTMLEIYGGGSYFMGTMYSGGDAAMMGGMTFNMGVIAPPDGLDEVIKQFLDRPQFNSVVVKLTPTPPEDPYYYLQDDYKIPDDIRSTVSMDKVVYGYYVLPIEILAKDEVTAPEGTAPGSEQAPEATPPFVEPTQKQHRNPYRNG